MLVERGSRKPVGRPPGAEGLQAGDGGRPGGSQCVLLRGLSENGVGHLPFLRLLNVGASVLICGIAL